MDSRSELMHMDSCVSNCVQKSWFVENDGSYKRLDHYFAKGFELKTPSGSCRYEYMRKVVKTCCSLQNRNAAVERVFQTTKTLLQKIEVC